MNLILWAAFFMFSDGVNAISSMQTYIQNDITSFSATQTVVQGFITAITSIIGCLMFLVLAKRYNVSTKTNLMIIVVATGIVPIWGCFGIGFSNFGIRTNWELWVLSVWSGKTMVQKSPLSLLILFFVFVV
jgi:MFS-type transporter involved in bile tolerance (Atg22 family)